MKQEEGVEADDLLSRATRRLRRMGKDGQVPSCSQSPAIRQRRSMRAVKGSLGHSPKGRGIESWKALAGLMARLGVPVVGG